MKIHLKILMPSQFSKLRKTMPLGIALLLTSCGVQDIASVQAFATLASRANERYPSLVADFYYSCVRAAEFEADIIPTRQDIETRCDRYQQLQPGLLAINQVLESYIRALGTLASDRTIVFDTEFQNLGSAVDSLPSVQPQQTSAVINLINFLVNASVDNYRREELTDVIEISNADLQVVLQTQKDIFDSEYKRLLLIESDTVDDFYRQKMLELQGNPGEMLNVRQQWQEERRLVAQKLEAADAYVKILDQLGESHQGLYDNRDRLNSEDLAQLMLQHAYKLKPLIESLVEAFS
jgi:hypothetical protein